jgi:hypothetical protein
LAPHRQARDDHVQFLHSAGDSDWRKYTSVMLDPVVIYSGSDGRFDATSEADKTALAACVLPQFAAALATRYAPAAAPGPDTLRIRLTLTGVETSTLVLSTLTKIHPFPLLINSVQTARDRQAVFTGSVS